MSKYKKNILNFGGYIFVASFLVVLGLLNVYSKVTVLGEVIELSTESVSNDGCHSDIEKYVMKVKPYNEDYDTFDTYVSYTTYSTSSRRSIVLLKDVPLRDVDYDEYCKYVLFTAFCMIVDCLAIFCLVMIIRWHYYKPLTNE